MSYDLFFTAPEGSKPNERFWSFFRGRRNYTVQNDQAWYSNRDTGVYFSFELSGPQGNESKDWWATFHINFFRPHFFSLEALPELREFATQLQVEVHDPHANMDGNFSDQGFLHGWEEGNRHACRAFIGQGVEKPACRPREYLERVWRWNQGRRALQDELGDRIFVPLIRFYHTTNGPLTGCVWTDAIPTVIPDTEVVVLYRDSLAPRRWFRKKDQVCLLRRKSIEPILPGFRRASNPVGHVFLDYSKPPPPIVQLFRSADASEEVSQVSVENVLDAEYFVDTA